MMKMKIIVALLVSLFVSSAHAQVEGMKDSISIKLDQGFLESSTPQQNENKLEAIESENKIDAAELERRAAFVRSLQFQMPREYKGPIAEESIIGRTMPEYGQYAYYQHIELDDDLSLSTASFQRNYQTIGSNRMINFSLNFEATDWLTVSGGLYGAKYNMASYSPTTGPGAMHYNDMGINASLRFKLHDRIYLRTHGQYSINSFDRSRNFSPATRGMFPQTYYGGGMEFKVTEKFGVEGGMVRELNPMTGKWTNSPYIMPIFYPLGRR